jgi:hypothetical protein
MLTQIRYVPGKDGVSLGRFRNRNPLRAGNLQHRGVEDEHDLRDAAMDSVVFSRQFRPIACQIPQLLYWCCVALALSPEANSQKTPGWPPKANVSAASLSRTTHALTKQEIDDVPNEAKSAGGEVTTPAVEAFWGGYPGYFRDLDGYLWEVVWHPGFPLDAKGVVALPVWRMSDPSSDNPIVILGLLRRRSTEKKKIELTREILLPGRVGGDLSFWRTGRLFSTILKMRRTGTVIGIARSKSRCRNPEAGFGTERPRRIVRAHSTYLKMKSGMRRTETV